MPSRFTKLIDTLRSSYWFLPGLMAATAVVLSYVTVAIDELYPTVLDDIGIGSGGVDGARGLLETAAGSLITVAGVSFSIAIVLMSLASSQFGPRLLRTFMRDTGNQVVLGVFVSTFLYCLLVLRTIRGEDAGGLFVPHLSVSISVVLTVASLIVFIYFIHHAAQLIQVSHILVSVGRDLEEVIDRVVPAESRSREDDHIASNLPTSRGRSIRADSAGYVQTIDREGLVEAAVERDLLVRLTVRAGSHVVPGTLLAEVWPAEGVDDAATDAIRGAIAWGDQRTEQQDIDFGFQQLGQIALRALSPAINDPFTAGICVDRLGSVLCRLAERPRPPLMSSDEGGQPRVIAQELAFTTLLSSAFDEIRRAGRDIIYILDRLAATLARIAERACRHEDLEALRVQVELVLMAARHGSHPDAELVGLEATQRSALATIDRRLSEVARRER
ncbi:MAG: DUF2254 domain-containing protein [Chloroflexota bacterium]|nr:DUF2254 domain-containing protein [Chloroflexota bacterium]